MKQPLNNRIYYVALVVALLLLSAASARVITVDDDGPADFNNIQAAIDHAEDGDTVMIEAGTYSGSGNYNVQFHGKAITVRGTDPEDFDIVAATVIDCNRQGRGFIFEGGEDANSVLSGLTITNGGCIWRQAFLRNNLKQLWIH